MSFVCPVCGYDGLNERPWSDNRSGSDEICPSCGIQFGYDDAAGGKLNARLGIWKDWRTRWVQNGMKWSSLGITAPADWNPENQLKRVEEDKLD